MPKPLLIAPIVKWLGKIGLGTSVGAAAGGYVAGRLDGAAGRPAPAPVAPAPVAPAPAPGLRLDLTWPVVLIVAAGAWWLLRGGGRRR